METFKASHIFIDVTLSERLLADVGVVGSTQVPTLSTTHPSYTKILGESCSEDVPLGIDM